MDAPALPPDPAAAAADLWERARALVADLDAADWARATPCAGWDVKDLVGHLSGIQTALDASAPQPAPPEGWAPPEGAAPLDAWTEAAVAARRRWSVAQVLAELDTARAAHVARLEAVTDWDAERQGPVGQTSEAGLFAVRAFDLWVHLQDLRIALGFDVEAGDPSAAARTAYGYVHRLLPWLYAKRVQAPEGSTLRLVLRAPYAFDAVLHRGADGRARWDPDADPGSGRVEADPAAFTLLVSGRGDREGWCRAGLLDWAGTQGEAFVARARMF